MAKVVGTKAASRRRFGQCLTFFKTSSSRVRQHSAHCSDKEQRQDRSLRKALDVKHGEKAIPLRAVDIFKRRQSSLPEMAGLPFGERMKRISRRWKALSNGDKAEYKQLAESMGETVAAISGKTLNEYNRDVLPSEPYMGKHTRGSRKRQAVANTMNDIKKHRIFNGGLGMGDVEGGLAAKYIDMESTDEQIRAEAKKMFDFKREPCGNPPGTMAVPKICTVRCGGMCCKDSAVDVISAATYNCVKAIATYKKMLPVAMAVKVGGGATGWQYGVLTKIKTKAVTALIVAANVPWFGVFDGDRPHALQATYAVGDNAVMPSTMQMVFRSVVLAERRAIEQPNFESTTLSVRLFAYKGATDRDHVLMMTYSTLESIEVDCLRNGDGPAEEQRCTVLAIWYFGYAYRGARAGGRRRNQSGLRL